MLSTLLMDGRYQDLLSLSLLFTAAIKLAFEAYVCYTGAINYFQEKGNVPVSMIVGDKYSSALQQQQH
jgi:hypothetical protein